jgi:hypothetical protein
MLTVTDDDGLTDTDYTVADVYGPNPPLINLYYPSDDDIIKDTITIEWYAYDSETGSNLPIYLFISSDDGQNWKSFSDNPYENTGELNWNTNSYNDGEYKLLIEAVDNDGNVGHDSCRFEIKNHEEPPENHPPDKPTRPSGETNGKAGEEYTYSTYTSDQDNDEIWFKWNWGDGKTSEWIGPYNSGETCEISHNWDEKDDYEIKVKSKDDHGEESTWSDPLSISMPKNKPSINGFIEFLMERFPILYQIFQRLLSF